MARSSILHKTGVIEIGRKAACSCGVAVLGTGVIHANFHCFGTMEVAMGLLNRRASGLQKTGAPDAGTTLAISPFQLMCCGVCQEL